MGPKYEFTNETIKQDGRILHRIRRLSDGRLGGYIEKEENLSQEGNCWVDDNAKVYGDAKVYGNARVSNNACVVGNAQVYGRAIVNDDAQVYGNAKVYENAQVFGNAKILGNAQADGNAKVYDNAQVYGHAEVHENAKVYGNAHMWWDTKVYGNVEVYGNANMPIGNFYTGKYDGTLLHEVPRIIKEYVDNIDDSLKLDVQSTYDSVDAFFDDNSDNSYIEHECLTIITVDTKIPIFKIEKTHVKNKNVFKFIFDITNEDGDDYRIHSVIESRYKFEQLVQSTINILKDYIQFIEYIDDLENCLY